MMILLACAEPVVTLDSKGEVPEDSARPEDTDTGVTDTGAEALCSPTADPVYVEEGEALSLVVRCATGADATISVAPVPDGAVWEAASATLSWTPGPADAGRHDLALLATTANGPEQGAATVWVADGWAAADNVPVDPTTYQEEYGVPVLFLTTPADINADDDRPTEVVWRGVSHTIGVQYRGASSLYYPKKSYKLSFDKDDEFEDEATDFPKRHTVVLTTPFDDPTYIRQKLSFDTWSAIGPERRQVETRFVVLYLDGAYHGLYMLGDHIDKEWWEDQGFTENGNLYKSVDHSASFYNDSATGWEKKDGEPADDFSDLTDFISFVVHSSDTEFVSRLDSFIPEEDVADWWVMCVGAWIDDSCGKNAYLYRDAATDDRFRHVPWDFNASWGQEWETSKTDATIDYDFSDTNNLFARSLDEADHLSPLLLDNLHAMLAGPMGEAEQTARIDGYEALIGPSRARDWSKWRGDFAGYFGWGGGAGTSDQELAYLRDWIVDRNAFLTARYP